MHALSLSLADRMSPRGAFSVLVAMLEAEARIEDKAWAKLWDVLGDVMNFILTSDWYDAPATNSDRANFNAPTEHLYLISYFLRKAGSCIYHSCSAEFLLIYVSSFYGSKTLQKSETDLPMEVDDMEFRFQLLQRVLHPDLLREFLMQAKPWETEAARAYLRPTELAFVQEGHEAEVSAICEFFHGGLQRRNAVLTALLHVPKDYYAGPDRPFQFVDLPRDVQRSIIELESTELHPGSSTQFLAKTRFAGPDNKDIRVAIDAVRGYVVRGFYSLLDEGLDEALPGLLESDLSLEETLLKMGGPLSTQEERDQAQDLELSDSDDEEAHLPALPELDSASEHSGSDSDDDDDDDALWDALWGE